MSRYVDTVTRANKGKDVESELGKDELDHRSISKMRKGQK